MAFILFTRKDTCITQKCAYEVKCVKFEFVSQ